MSFLENLMLPLSYLGISTHNFRMNTLWLEGFSWFLRHLVSNWNSQLQTHTFGDIFPSDYSGSQGREKSL